MCQLRRKSSGRALLKLQDLPVSPKLRGLRETRVNLEVPPDAPASEAPLISAPQPRTRRSRQQGLPQNLHIGKSKQTQNPMKSLCPNPKPLKSYGPNRHGPEPPYSPSPKHLKPQTQNPKPAEAEGRTRPRIRHCHRRPIASVTGIDKAFRNEVHRFHKS